MASMFDARYTSKCSNGHLVKVGDTIGYNDQGRILCARRCIQELQLSLKTNSHPTLFSNNFCGSCGYELPLANDGKCDNCE